MKAIENEGVAILDIKMSENITVSEGEKSLNDKRQPCHDRQHKTSYSGDETNSKS